MLFAIFSTIERKAVGIHLPLLYSSDGCLHCTHKESWRVEPETGTSRSCQAYTPLGHRLPRRWLSRCSLGVTYLPFIAKKKHENNAGATKPGGCTCWKPQDGVLCCWRDVTVSQKRSKRKDISAFCQRCFNDRDANIQVHRPPDDKFDSSSSRCPEILACRVYDVSQRTERHPIWKNATSSGRARSPGNPCGNLPNPFGSVQHSLVVLRTALREETTNFAPTWVQHRHSPPHSDRA